MSECKDVEATSTRKKLMLHRSLESWLVQDRVNANPDGRIYCNLTSLNLARCKSKQKYSALSVFFLAKRRRWSRYKYNLETGLSAEIWVQQRC